MELIEKNNLIKILSEEIDIEGGMRARSIGYKTINYIISIIREIRPINQQDIHVVRVLENKIKALEEKNIAMEERAQSLKDLAASKDELINAMRKRLSRYEDVERLSVPCQNEWISVEDELPNVGESIMLYTKDGGVAEGMLSGAQYWVQYRWNARIAPEHVTHWSYRPEPPKEKPE